MEEVRKRLLFLAVLVCIIIIGSYYVFRQQNSMPESTAIQVQTEESSTQSLLTVYISGAVLQPGVVKVSASSRVIDVINTAGGLAQGAEIDKLNLAQVVKDGMHIKVPGAKLTPQTALHAINSNKVNGKVNINTADTKELDSLPGIGPALAQRIIEYRQANGLFKEVEHIKNVSGISDSKYSKLKDKITI